MMILKKEDFFLINILKRDIFLKITERDKFLEKIKELDKDNRILEEFSSNFLEPVFSIYEYYSRPEFKDRVDNIIKYLNI